MNSSGEIKDILVAGLRVKVLLSAGVVDIRGRNGDAFFFMAAMTPERTPAHLKACFSAVEEAIRQAGKS